MEVHANKNTDHGERPPALDATTTAVIYQNTKHLMATDHQSLWELNVPRYQLSTRCTLLRHSCTHVKLSFYALVSETTDVVMLKRLARIFETRENYHPRSFAVTASLGASRVQLPEVLSMFMVCFVVRLSFTPVAL